MPKPAQLLDPHYYLQAMLSQRDHTIGQVKDKLKRRGFGPSDVEETVAWGVQKGWLDDKKYAEKFIENTLRFKPVGPKWIRAKLQQRHIPSSIITTALEANYTSEREKEAAQAAAASWRRLHPKYKDDRNRLSRFLASRGFSSSAMWQ